MKLTPKLAYRIVKYTFLGLILLKFVGCLVAPVGQWGPEVRGELPDGGYVFFQARPRGRETDDRLTWVNKRGERKDFWVDQIHAGFEYVTLYMRKDGSGVWVESDGGIGASLDLTTGKFRSEHEEQFPWAYEKQGVKLAEGRTWSYRWLIYPL